MKTWEDVACKAKELYGAASRKVADVADLAKQKLKMAENEKAITATMEALGRLLYDSRHAATELDESIVGELVKQVDDLLAANEELQANIDNSCGKKTCPACGNVNPSDAAYCNNCGKKLD
ncbi:MAG: zinc ribbon domain-containing protein [Clostridia bacterium]|nr:zinc ribbon domain-containing protein [Clostridia bacterium]